jgi:hypothetical protein
MAASLRRRESGSREMSTVDVEELVRAAVSCRICELAIALQLFVVTNSKCSINPITNPNSVYSHTHTRDNIILLFKDILCVQNTTRKLFICIRRRAKHRVSAVTSLFRIQPEIGTAR